MGHSQSDQKDRLEGAPSGSDRPQPRLVALAANKTRGGPTTPAQLSRDPRVFSHAIRLPNRTLSDVRLESLDQAEPDLPCATINCIEQSRLRVRSVSGALRVSGGNFRVDHAAGWLVPAHLPGTQPGRRASSVRHLHVPPNPAEGASTSCRSRKRLGAPGGAPVMLRLRWVVPEASPSSCVPRRALRP